jgi:CRISPR-associated protein (TIGR02584 family)
MGDYTYKTVLVAGVGLSPTVLTNTTWALVHENPPVVPEEVVAVTTAIGRNCIANQLIISNAWIFRAN